jgi:hypothetical protein
MGAMVTMVMARVVVMGMVQGRREMGGMKAGEGMRREERILAGIGKLGEIGFGRAENQQNFGRRNL